MRCFAFMLSLLLLPVLSWGQDDREAVDNALAARLQRDGVRHETRRALVWVEKDSLTDQEITDFLRFIDPGIGAIEKYLGVTFASCGYKSDKVEYYISPTAGMSRASFEYKPQVFMSSRHVKAKSSGYLHETAHVLSRWSKNALWIMEGLATHVDTIVKKQLGDGSINIFNLEELPTHRKAAQIIQTPAGRDVLPLMGMDGSPITMTDAQKEIFRPLFDDRRAVTAPAFYNLSESFVTFVIEKLGMAKMREIASAPSPRAAIRRLSGRTMDQWKADWLKMLRKSA